ncbi:MAG: dienelactone hydrolase family protein [Planctomycetia bacterium]|nr:dienelactone hydrolase family protein [Planctomycetia bacterium]
MKLSKLLRRIGARTCLLLVAIGILNARPGYADDEPRPLPGTQPLTQSGDLSALMRSGFEKFLLRELDASVALRERHWIRDFSSREAYEKSVHPNRERFRKLIGAVDPRVPVGDLELVSSVHQPALLAETSTYSVFSVRWPVLLGITGEGLLLLPKSPPIARIVAVPDADQTPEQLTGIAEGIPPEKQFARRLAEQGCLVVVPVLISREDTLSGNPAVAMTNHPHREWVYRQAFEFGRHIIGYEVQKVLALVDWFASENARHRAPIGVAGYCEGGLLAFSSAALDTRIDAALVSGYFDSRQKVYDEPIYRNLLGLLREFGDAELASLVAPRALIVEHSPTPEVAGPPTATTGRSASAAPGRITTPADSSVAAEVTRAGQIFPKEAPVKSAITLIAGESNQPTGFGSEAALRALIKGLGVGDAWRPSAAPAGRSAKVDPAPRQERQLRELVEYTQRLLRLSHKVREQFWIKAKPDLGADKWAEQTASYRDYLWDEIVGRFPPPTLPANPRTRQVVDRPKWTGYEVVLDVYPDVICWGYLLVPKGMRKGEQRPVVVCQHGLEGVPNDTVTEDPKAPGYGPYKGFSARLADRGFVVYAPHNFYRGGNEFRQLQRKAHPLKKTLFGLTTIQHQQHLDWLASLNFVDGERIGFYGLSYGGNTAVRVPALLTKYACVISSGDFNEWIFKNTTTDYFQSMVYHNVYEVWEWDLGHTFNHSDLAALIAPRPFMVERGHTDGVGIDEWVAGEYARVRRLYAFLGIPERTEIEFFNGPHTINGVGTFDFLHRHLKWPKPSGD